eukprot:Gb_08257 [translate_table: standard]
MNARNVLSYPALDICHSNQKLYIKPSANQDCGMAGQSSVFIVVFLQEVLVSPDLILYCKKSPEISNGNGECIGNTLRGQTFGAGQSHMLGVYMQRSWIIFSITVLILLPVYIFATPTLKLSGQTDDVSDLAGEFDD